MNYLSIIKEAVYFFPVIAFLITIPFILIQYHKFGSISMFKSFIIYSLVLYLICSYFLVILPLPSREQVLALTTPRSQLIPFKFIYDFIYEIDFSKNIFKQMYLYMPLFNLFLTIPFGIYISYLFKTSLKKTTMYTFLLSLFFEITQLTGLYFIYPRGYRLFDVDDLILNTLGGLLGYFLSKLIIKLIPTIDRVNDNATMVGMSVSGFKKTTSICLDFFLYSIFTIIMSFIFGYKWITILTLIIYYLIIPSIKNGSTIGQKYLNLRVVSYNNGFSTVKLFIRICLFIVLYGLIPLLLLYTALHISVFNITDTFKGIIIMFICLFIALYYFIIFIKIAFTRKLMLYEKLSKTKLISTIAN